MSRMCISSSIVKVAPHLGHLTFVSFFVIPAQPKENPAKTTMTKNIQANFCIFRYLPFLDVFWCLVAEIRVINFLLVAPFYDHLCFRPGNQGGSRRRPRLGSKAGQKIQACLRRRRRGVSSRLIHGEFTVSGCQSRQGGIGPPGRGWYFNFGN